MKEMNSSNKLIAILIFVLLLVAVLLFRQNHNLSKIIKNEKGLEIGGKAYTFDATDLKGRSVSISRNALLIFFNTTCEACEITASRWQALYEKYGSKEFGFVGISIEPQEETQEFILKHELTFPIVLDEQKNIARKYLVKHSPQFVMINDKGRVVYYSRFGTGVRKVLNEVEEIIQNIES
jgi:peroxiredoxin